MLSQVSKWGNSQGIRISKKILRSADINIDDEVEIKVHNNAIIIKSTAKKSLDWYLDGYGDGDDRFDWEDLDEPKGRELL
ncbi:MAG: AbrB/MazE/SpoVT family DNA-binding domain-containing protein [Defluviitaleaceae bacterium]|nr:AbrB/MazE/SpoVT family DNA-binding domain-containing protein [Defluviitaleaceae bacterium]